jgi:PAS domain S-box-containing protein
VTWLTRTGEGRGVLLGLFIVAVLSLLDAFVWKNVVLIGLLILGPLVASTRSGPRGVLLVAAAALLAGLLLGFPDGVFGTTDHLLRLLIVAAGGLMALWTAGIRQARERTAALLAVQASVARILASSSSLEEAAPKVLAAIGELLGWPLGALWSVRPRTGTLVCAETWQDPDVAVDTFTSQSRQTVFRRGEGLPGRVWQSGRAAWLADVSQDDNFSRAEAAAAAGLRAAFCFPIRGASGILGAVEFFAKETRAPDTHLLDLMDTLGGQLGDYVERKLAEEKLQVSDARKTAVLQSAIDCIISMDHQGRVVDFNPAATRTFGYTSEEAIGRELADLIVPPDLRERHREGLARFLATGESPVLDRRIELRGMDKHGTEFPVELAITRIGVEPPMFTGYVRDLREQRLAEETRRRLASIVESSEDAILSKDRNAMVTSWNRGAEMLYGYTPEEAIGMPIARLVPEHRHGEEMVILERILRGEHVAHYDTERVRKDGVQIKVSLTISPIHDALGATIGASVIARDITRATFLSEAQRLLSSSLDYMDTLNNLARLVVPDVADWCAVDIVRPDGALERLVRTHVDPEMERLAVEIEERYPPEHSRERGALKAIVTRESELIREIPRELLERAARDEDHMKLIERFGLRSAMIVPLVARDRALGVLTFASAESSRLFDETDLAFAEDLASRAAIAVDNARLYGERAYIASTLQQALMPENLPDVPGVELAARYLAAGEGNEVGGDFYDIYRAGESTWGIAIGDVRGKGARAAAVTALARYALRTASLTETVPSRVLALLNEAMLRQRADDRFCTVAYASIESTDAGVSMRLGVGGHPLPLLLRADGSVERVGTPGTLIGLVPDPDIVDVRMDLQPGDSLVLYTDGVSEARSDGDLFGEERLIDLVKGCAGLDATGIAERIERDVLTFQGDENADDLAVLVLRVREVRAVNRTLAAKNLRPVRSAPA